MPTLSFQRDDVSPANLISTAIFGDGAAAALVTGREIAGVRMLDTRSHLFPRSLDALGFDPRRRTASTWCWGASCLAWSAPTSSAW